MVGAWVAEVIKQVHARPIPLSLELPIYGVDADPFASKAEDKKKRSEQRAQHKSFAKRVAKMGSEEEYAPRHSGSAEFSFVPRSASPGGWLSAHAPSKRSVNSQVHPYRCQPTTCTAFASSAQIRLSRVW